MGTIAQKKGLGKKEIVQAEGIINDKINSLADWLETQEKWTILDAYVVLKFTLEKSIKNQLTPQMLKLAEDAYNAIEIRKKLN